VAPRRRRYGSVRRLPSGRWQARYGDHAGSGITAPGTFATRVLELYRASLDQRRRLGLPHILVLANLAQAEVEAGFVDDGRRDAREALRITWNRHDPLDWTIALITFAQAAVVDGLVADGLTILGALLDRRRTPSLESEIDAVLQFHGIERSAAVEGMARAAETDLDTVVDGLLGGSD
jgi:hypothetical protein